ncbi:MULTISPECIES: ferredoxin [Cupriavidus]|jgi:ferredoxin|uniref:ferredoxin n=1 Tax=Cupriavidus TaxID=106589 RepID=UPI0005B3F621|nr:MULTISPECIES: ferredoxin [Cupriavidus]QUN32380.1 ferredoxin [Cupriavidus sp. KK10]
MKIRIESERCKGHQNCVRAAPELFVVGEDGFAQVRECGDVPPALKEQALLAWANCPEFAIEVEDAER